MCFENIYFIHNKIAKDKKQLLRNEYKWVKNIWVWFTEEQRENWANL